MAETKKATTKKTTTKKERTFQKAVHRTNEEQARHLERLTNKARQLTSPDRMNYNTKIKP